MTPEEAFAMLAYANQTDKRVELNESAYDAWEYALADYPADEVRWHIMDYYARGNLGGSDYQPPIGPAIIRKRIAAARETATAQQSANVTALTAKQRKELTGGKPVTEGILRKRDPEKWDALKAAGAEHRAAMLAEHGHADVVTHGVLPASHPLKTWTGR